MILTQNKPLILIYVARPGEINHQLFNLHLFQSEMREFWMYQPDYRIENDIRGSYNSVESMLVEYGLMNIY